MHHQEHVFYKNKWFLLAAGVLLLVTIDQCSKRYMQDILSGYRTIPILENVIELRYLENTGASFGILKGKLDVILLATFAMIVYLIWEYRKIKLDRKHALFGICCCLCIAGGIGNMLDRMTLGYVIDFIYIKLIEFPIFNLADCFIVISLIILFALTYREIKEHKQKEMEK